MRTYKSNRNPEDSVVKTAVLKEMRKRVVKSFLDVIILANLRNGGTPMGGYDVISFIKKEFRIQISSGTIYSTLYFLERNGLLEFQFKKRKRVFALTNKGANKIETILEEKPRIMKWIAELFM